MSKLIAIILLSIQVVIVLTMAIKSFLNGDLIFGSILGVLGFSVVVIITEILND